MAYNNYSEINLTLNRIDICDLLIACLAAKEVAGDSGKKWDALHDKLWGILKAEDEKNMEQEVKPEVEPKVEPKVEDGNTYKGVHITQLEMETLRAMLYYGFFFDDLDDTFVCWGVEGKEYRACQTTLHKKGVISVWHDDGDTYVNCGKGWNKYDILKISKFDWKKFGVHLDEEMVEKYGL